MKFVHVIPDADSSSHGGGKEFAGGGGSLDPRLNSTGTPSLGIFSSRGSSVYSFHVERVKGDGSSAEKFSPDNYRARMMGSDFNLVSR